MNGDEQLLRGRVYGRDHDASDPGSEPGRTYAELVGGPLDGLLLAIHGWPLEEVDGGVALITELSRWPGGRALYDPRPGEPREPGPEPSAASTTAATLPGQRLLLPSEDIRPTFDLVLPGQVLAAVLLASVMSGSRLAICRFLVVRGGGDHRVRGPGALCGRARWVRRVTG
jgi:hypothetical protein